MNIPSGATFLESLDTFAIFKNGEELFILLYSMIQRVGEENVTQDIIEVPLLMSLLEEKYK